VLGIGPEALVAESRRRNAYAVEIARRDAGSARKRDVETVDVGALSAQIAGLQHERDVAQTAAFGLRIAGRIRHDPIVDAFRFL
jgi:hypothetical protein